MTPHIESIIETVLSKLPYDREITYTQADCSLVLITMLAGTNLLSNKNSDVQKIGMMDIFKEDLKWLIYDYIKPTDSLNDFVYSASMVDLDNFSWENILFAATHNIAFQVAIVYLWFMWKANRPETMEEAVQLYMEHWNGNGGQSASMLGSMLAGFYRKRKQYDE